MISLDSNQAQAVKFDEDKHLLVLAGAGSGKTRVIIERIKFLINSGIDISKIAVMTFTKKAAMEIQDRVKNIGHDTKGSFFAGTFHSFALEMINNYGFFKADINKRIIDRDDQLWLAQICLEELGISPNIANDLISKISYSKNIMMPIKSYLKKFYHKKDDQELLLKACMLYESKKETGGYLDYDDLMVHFLKVIQNNREARDKICSKYSHILVDEMQDTNPLQWKILQQYAKYIKLFCVGDDAQSIYAFRGADFKNVHAFTEKLKPSKTIKLINNYRSTKEILDLSNSLLKRSIYNYDKELVSIRGKGKSPKIYDFYSMDDEAAYVTKYIKQKKKLSDVMVLVRSAFNAKALEKELILQHVPYVFIGGQNLMQSEHIKDVLSILQIVYGYRDELSVHRFIKVTKSMLLDNKTLHPKDLLSLKNDNDVFKKIKLNYGESSLLYETMEKLKEINNKPPKAVAISTNMLKKYLQDKYQRRYKNIVDELQFVEKIASKYDSTQAFLQSYILNPAYKNEDKEKKCIKIITIHSAKGTEAKYCILLQANNDVYPHKRAKNNIESVEEERRILYVAMTRAQDELIITRTRTSPRNRNKNGCEEYFLGDLEGELV